MTAQITTNPAIDACVAVLQADIDGTLENARHEGISDNDLMRVLSAASRLYAARAEARETYPPPVANNEVTATDVLVTVSEMIRAVDLNLFDLSMWFNRPRAEQGARR
jgi:hypothetical protein